MSDSVNVSDRVKELAAMPELDYELIRTKEAKALGVRPGKLDEFVSESREPDIADIEEGIGNELMNGLEPWLKPVNGVEIADHIKTTFNKYCSLSSGRDIALTLWCMAGYSINQFRIFPKACLSSPEKRCGKTTTLDVAAAFCNRPLLASNTSASVLFRAVDLWQPTMLMDECDTFIHGNDELRGIINSGHTKSTAVVWRIDGEGSNMMPKPFSTWSPMLIAMIKKPPSTIEDRSIMINLKRKLVSDFLEKLPLDLSEDCKDTRRKCKRWSDDNSGLLRASNPDVPKISNDRAMDNWMPLLAVADAIGGQWPKLARSAMMNIEDVCSDDQDGNYGVMLLEDIQVIFDNTKHDKIYTEDLIIQLNELKERPWCEYRNGQEMSARSLSKLLSSFSIKSGTIRINSGTKKGYKYSSFTDAFERYLSPTLPDTPILSVTPTQPLPLAALSVIQKGNIDASVTDKKPIKPLLYKDCNGVTDKKGVSGGKGEDEGKITLKSPTNSEVKIEPKPGDVIDDVGHF